MTGADDLHVVFGIGEATYAIPAADVLQIETYEGATPVPGTAPWVAGIVQIRGRVVPVIDLRRRFGLAPAPRTLDTRVIVVQRGPRVVGLVVDRARDVVRLAAGQVQAMPAGPDEHGHDLVRAIAQTDRGLLMMVDVETIVGQEPIAHGQHPELQPG